MKSAQQNTLGFLLHDASRLMRRRFEARGAVHGLSSSQWRALVYLARTGGLAQARLAEFLEVEPISVSRLVDRMEQGGWVRRSPDPQDRRVRLVHATEKAMSAFEEVKALAGEVYEEALAGIDPAQRAALMAGLSQVVANLQEMDCAPACGRTAREEGDEDERAK
ncbi:MAG: MarR family transcriptional regulator [Allgaiera sp.]|jgi:MarR family transcriptional regulator for hemolysin|nr:MarR family transcriptional regulator [Allgaiera sp.]